ncbi:MAG: ribonuclease HII [Bdellovibrionales bacterium]|nr:ribonuclease HII [Bdellovibrionales bacterium]
MAATSKLGSKKPKTIYEKYPWQNLTSQRPIIGVDEVGRGCLAGPVYAAAVVLNEQRPWQHYTDSKLLSEARREEYAVQILADHRVGIGFATVEEISQLNILRAALLAMRRAVEQLELRGGHALVDGNQAIPGLTGYSQTPLVKGDLRAEPVAAASIVAKVTRDRLMKSLSAEFAGYGFEVHKGYATPEHKQAIQRLGPCALHRPTFAGVREYLSLGAARL